jgi:hypothetical protein
MALRFPLGEAANTISIFFSNTKDLQKKQNGSKALLPPAMNSCVSHPQDDGKI